MSRPTEIVTPSDVEKALVEEMRKLRELPERIKTCAIDAAQKENRYKISFSQERLKARAEAKITEALAEDLANVATETLRLEYVTSQAILGASRDSLKVAIARIDALRSLSASIRQVT